jgi:ubiquinone/menaquinone biosynthesis C-methylase UbiE
LDFEQGKFDLVLIRSVFTHLTETSQKSWLEELHRVTKPQGSIIFTVHGNNFIPTLAPGELHEYSKGNLIVREGIFEGTNKCAASIRKGTFTVFYLNMDLKFWIKFLEE